MRTTLTLDDDIVASLKIESKKSGKSFREILNHFLRIGLNSSRQPKNSKPFRVRTRKLGPRPGLNFDNISELLEQVEGPLHK